MEGALKILDVDFKSKKLNFSFDQKAEIRIKEIDGLFRLALERFCELNLPEDQKVDVAKILAKLLKIAKHSGYQDDRNEEKRF